MNGQKIAALGTTTMLPAAKNMMLSSLVRGASKVSPKFPKPGRLPAISAAFKDSAHEFSPSFTAAKQVEGTIRAPATKAIEAAHAIDSRVKKGSAAFFDELKKIAAAGNIEEEVLEKCAELDVEEMMKAALSVGGLGGALKGFAGAAGGAMKGLGGALKGGLGSVGGAMKGGLGSVGGALKGGLGRVGGAVGGALQPARGAIANVAGKISPTLNKPVMQAAQGAAHTLQKSPNSFLQGVGNVMHHKTQTPGKMFLAAANPVGSAAEALTAGAGTAASKGLAGLGGRLQKATAAGDAVAQAGRAMTPKGRLMNAASSFGGRMQQTFSPGGMGHNVATKYLPLAGELGGAVGAGMALHAPVGLAGVAGKLGLGAVGKAAPAIGHAIEHGAHALGGAGHAVQHAAEDLLGTKGQGILGRFGRPAVQAARHSMMPAMAH